MASTQEMKKFVSRCCQIIVVLYQKKKEELTTEGGLNVKKISKYLKQFVKEIKDNGVKVSLFVDPDH